jgi:hypothetical protein
VSVEKPLGGWPGVSRFALFDADLLSLLLALAATGRRFARIATVPSMILVNVVLDNKSFSRVNACEILVVTIP